MFFLQGNNQQATTLFRRLLTIAFFIWLTILITQYYWQTLPKKSELPDEPISNRVLVEKVMLPPLPEPKNQTRAIAHSEIIKKEADSPTPNKKKVEQIYHQLSEEGVDIQIAWPQRANERQAALNFIYQCVGVQFAILNDNHITKLNQTNLTDYSDWIRAAQGSLSRNEQNWLNAYNLIGIPIRLFPRNIDWRLAQYLTNALNGEPLTSFRANYKVTNQKLHLTNIHLNSRPMSDSWILYQGEC